MNYYHSRVFIDRIQISEGSLSAQIQLSSRAVFLISLLSATGEQIHKRFVQLEHGLNNLQFTVGNLERGDYQLCLMQGFQETKAPFQHV
ncbi:MAG: hypothetical protein H7Y31_08275 [Chitinophagaceae bacterium]|nr:hypothetical protein [Chitinophagaceae bacterium]